MKKILIFSVIILSVHQAFASKQPAQPAHTDVDQKITELNHKIARHHIAIAAMQAQLTKDDLNKKKAKQPNNNAMAHTVSYPNKKS